MGRDSSMYRALVAAKMPEDAKYVEALRMSRPKEFRQAVAKMLRREAKRDAKRRLRES